MADEQIQRGTPRANDQVNAFVGEFTAEQRREKAAQRATRHPSPLRYNIILVAATLVCVGLWIGPSFAPSREAVMTPEKVEQNARLNLYLTSLRVREYVAANRKLPDTLAELGVDPSGMEYSRGAGSIFELSMRVNGTPVVFTSTVPDSVFLGENLRIRGIS